MSVYGPFAAGDHMVQKPPYWRANCALGHLKQRKFKLSCFVLDIPVRNLLTSIAVFVPCDRQLQRAHRWDGKMAVTSREIRLTTDRHTPKVV